MGLCLIGRPSFNREGQSEIDTDFPGSDRNRVKEYMEQKYGASQVCSVGTYSALQLRAAIKDFSRLENIPFADVNYITGLLSDSDRKFEDLMVAACSNSRVKEFINTYPNMIHELSIILGAPKARSVHACAMMVFPDEHDMFRWCPIRQQDGQMVSEWEGMEMDSAGFLKEDILGVKQLDKFQDILRLIKENTGEEIDLYSVPLDDEKVFEFFQKGWNGDVFHFGSKGLTGYCKEVLPTCMEDLIAAISLYRPGAMENNFHKEYVLRKNGERPVEFYVGTEEILKETYGVFCIEENQDVYLQNEVKKIKDVSPGDFVLTEDGTYQKVLFKKNNGNKKLIKIHTSFGEDLVCTPDHRILTSDGWVEAGKLSKNNLIKSFFYPETTYTSENTLKEWLLGYFIAEGCSCSTPYYTVGTIDIAYKLKKMLESVFFNSIIEINENRTQSGRSFRVGIKSKNGNNGFFSKDFRKNEFNEFLKSFGLYGKKFDEKRLPENATLPMVIGVLEGDGCLKNNTLKMANPSLVKDVYKVLQAHQIYSSFFEKDGCGILSFNDYYNQLDFKILHKECSGKKGYGGFWIPSNLCSFDKKNMNYEKWKKNFSDSALKNKKYVRVGAIDQMAGVELPVHKYWSRVLSIEEVGDGIVYDLSIEKNHSFVVGGHVVHNCYQEQIMKLCQELGGLSLVEADDVRKAMVKKKYEALHQYKERFIPYYANNLGVTMEYSEGVWEAIDKAATYLFNKSHAAAYSITGYLSQWLKVHYPLEYWSVAFSYAAEDDYPVYVSEINRGDTGVKIMEVDINKSGINVVSDKETGNMYWALTSIKQAGEKACEQIFSEREQNGEYFSFEEFLDRHIFKGSKVNKSVIENLVVSGAFDNLEKIDNPCDRMRLIDLYRTKYRVKIDKDKDLFSSPKRSESWWWNILQKQISGYGWFDYRSIVEKFTQYDKDFPYVDMDRILEPKFGKSGAATTAGYVYDIDIKNGKNGQFCKIFMEHNYQFLTVICFPGEFPAYDDVILDSKGNILILNGEVYNDEYSGNNVMHVGGRTMMTLLKKD